MDRSMPRGDGQGLGPRQRAFGLGDYLRASAAVLRHLPGLLAAQRARRVAPALVHRMQLAVSAVNGCRYCSYEHAARLLESGASDREIAQVLAGMVDAFPPADAVALAFAQHYAESGGRPDPAARARLTGAYGAAASRDLHHHLRLVQWGSVGGNLLDAFLSRLRGAPVPGSRLRGELPVALLLGPLYLLALARGHRSGRFHQVREVVWQPPGGGA